MPDLLCNVTTCEHNKSDLCCKQGIKVGGEEANTSEYTKCESFYEKSEAFLNNVQSPNPRMDIRCEAANCVYNEIGMCGADMVSIAGGPVSSAAKTECNTFIPR